MAIYAKIGNNYWTVGDRSQLQRVSESDIIGRFGDSYFPRGLSSSEKLAYAAKQGEIQSIDPTQVQVEPDGALKVGGGYLQIGGSVAYVPNQATAQSLGIVAPQVAPGGTVRQDTSFSDYLRDTNQTFTPEQGFGGSGALPTLEQLQVQQAQKPQPQNVYRDEQDNFYVDGRKIELDEFKQLGINADFVPRGSTVNYAQAVIGQSNPSEATLQQIANTNPELADNIMTSLGYGQNQQGTSAGGTAQGSSMQSNADPAIASLPPEYQALYTQLETYLNELQKRGETINPNVEISPERIAEFTAQAQREIDPYYSTQLKLVREGFLRDLGYSSSQILEQETELERKYRNNLRTLGEQSAEQGFAQSGRRQQQERDLATETQSSIDQTRRQFSQQAGSAARELAQQYGSSAISSIPTLGQAPRVLAGEGSFQRTSRDLPLYELSNDTYDGLVGTQEFQQRAAVSTRASELEEAERSRLANQQTRQLTL